VPVELEFGLLYELEGRRIASITVFPDREDGLRAAGLEE
jgi:hypothetical protein